jgi:hypothetical protein
MGTIHTATETIEASVKTKHQHMLAQAIYRWRYLLDNARSELHRQDWNAAVDAYQQAYCQAELLIHIADCKNCAIKNYVRTLFEYGYSLCQTHHSDVLLGVLDIARQTLECYATTTLTQQLLKPIINLVHANSQQRDIWINQLFAEDALQQQAVH